MKLRTFKILGLFFGLVMVVGLMISCAAAVGPAIHMAGSGLTLLKGVQATTSGNVAVEFEETSSQAQDRKALSALGSLTIYPTNGNTGVGLAGVLEKAYKVVTPATVLKTIKYVDFETLTPQERVQKANEICRVFKTNGLLLYSEQKGITKSNAWALKRGTYTVVIVVEVFIPNQNRVIRRQGKVVFQLGGDPPPQEEVDKLIVSTIAEQFIS